MKSKNEKVALLQEIIDDAQEAVFFCECMASIFEEMGDAERAGKASDAVVE